MKKLLAVALVVLMVVSVLPMSAFAASMSDALSDAGYTIVSDDETTLAPGITMNEVVMYDSNGDRVEMYVTTSDTSVDTVKFYANYKDNQCATWGMQTLSEQVAAIEANYEEPFKVVAGLNASYYNTTTGAPTGAFVMEGVDASTSGDNYAFFAVLKDGTVMIGDKGEYSSYKGQIKEAIGGYIHIVKDGAIASGLDKVTKYPRQTIGMTADGKVITMTADGSQAPQTVGLTIYEQAQVMLELGCVEALHLDGGNSATFGAIREGTDKFVTVNSPSGQAERAVSNTLMIVSTAVADGTFDHAVISGDYDYFLPNTSYTFSAIPADATNAPAKDFPETVTWALSDDSFGTIENGKFTSNGKLGALEVQMVDGDKVVGAKKIEVVTPESISFGADEKTVPYGKTASMKVIAMYNNNEACSDADNFNWSLSPETAGTLNGFEFTAGTDETVTQAVLTASYKYDEAVEDAVVAVKFGKGSEVIFDFEDGDISEWRGTETINEWIDDANASAPADKKYTILKPESYGNPIEATSTSVFLATEENGGRVKTGDYALGFKINRLNATGVGSWVYNYLYYTGETQIWRDVANGKSAVRVGMWVNMTQNATNTGFRICRTFTKDESGKLYTNYDYMMSDYDGAKVSYNTNYGIPESGWIYVYFNLTAYDVQTSAQWNSYENYAMNNGKKADGNYFPAFIQFVNGDDTMEELVMYIDDITLDYSDVIDDRKAPVISDTNVSETIDSFVALNGQKLTNNCLSFSAAVADFEASNATGLDYSTAKIYIDGMDMSSKATFKAAGSSMTLTDVYLTNGAHSIAFVISDNQGNETRVTKTFTVAGSAENAEVYLSGHNNGGDTPKTGSVYYIDVKATDASQIKSIVTKIRLNSANAFESDHIACADGVSVTYSYDELNYELTLNITNDGALSGDAVLASIPVRVWSWDAEKTGITADAQFASGSIPSIDIEYQAVYGEVIYKSGTYDSYIAGFYSSCDVATEIDNKTAWHAHTESALADVPATCTDDGYEGRTYCEGCSSVVDWGTTLEAKGHNLIIVDGGLVCDVCGESDAKNGLAQIGDNYYYFANGSVKKGWQLVGSDWHYFDETTGAAVSGEKYMAPVTYVFEANGKLASGVWAKTLYGMRYYYGPGYYKNGWQTIDGKDYYFDDGNRIEGGWQLVLESQQYRNWYYFDSEGVCADKTLKPEDGLYTDRNGVAGSIDGVGLSGLRLVNGKYYYFNHHGYAQKNGTFSGRIFMDDYAAYTGLLEKDGVIYYYEDGITATCGLFSIDGDYYYVYWGGVVKTSDTYYVGRTYCDLPAGTYEFGDDGKMLNGIIEKDGVQYLYANGKLASYGLYKIENDYYFVSGDGSFVTDIRHYVARTYCDLPVGNYTFGSDGKMLDGVVEVDGTLYLYDKGTTATCGLFEIDGKYYYSYWGGVLKTDGRYYVSRTYCDLPAGNYTFGADGAMLDGVVEVDGTLYLYDKGITATCGLFEIDGKYYYSYWGGVLQTDGRYYVTRSYCDLPVGNYTFGSDGAMLDGVVEVDGTLYLYDKGTAATCGLFEIDGKYYYSYWGGVLQTDGRYYVTRSYCDLPIGNYTFGAGGKMLDGFITKDDGIYYYENGNTPAPKMIFVEGFYYYVSWGGKLLTNGTYYVPADGIYSDISMNLTFNELGQFVK